MKEPQPKVGYSGKLFLSPAEVARELRVSTSTVLRLIHAERLPAIYVSERIYRIPVASFEMFKAGALPKPSGEIRIGTMRPGRPRLGADERLPEPRRQDFEASAAALSGRRTR